MADAPPGKVLVVEDDPVFRDLLRVALESAGYATRGAENGFRALEAIRLETPAALILDLHLPAMDGMRLLKTLAGSGVTVPTIVVTGLDDSAISADLLLLGVRDVLTKPVSLDVLLARLKKSCAVQAVRAS